MPQNSNSSNSNGKKRNSKAKEDLFDALNPNNMMSNAQRVLKSAVDVLEEEIAAGILAAKKIETKIIDVDNIREDPQDLMNRIRRDVHEAVDLLMDSVTAISRQLGVLSDAVTKTSNNDKPSTSDTTSDKTKNEDFLPVIKNDKPVIAGNEAILQMTLSNTVEGKAVSIVFQKTDLAGPKGFKIPARNVSFRPATLTLQPGEEKDLAIHVIVPKKIIGGQYSALFVDANDSANKAIIHMNVE